ncbi:hypothetical protein [Rhodanobacter lindaniclasticus]
MMRHVIASLAVTAAILLAACASAPLHYYTFVARGAGGSVADPVTAIPFEVLPVNVLAQVDRPQLVVRKRPGRRPLGGDAWVPRLLPTWWRRCCCAWPDWLAAHVAAGCRWLANRAAGEP